MAAKNDQKFIERTKQVWQSYVPQPLSDEDAIEIADNMSYLFSFLAELDKKYGPANLQSRSNKDG